MGVTPAKGFVPPTPFGMAPVNTVSQAQPAAQVTGPGYAAISGFDQTQQPMQGQQMPYAQSLIGGSGPVQDMYNPLLAKRNQYLFQ